MPGRPSLLRRLLFGLTAVSLGSLSVAIAWRADLLGENDFSEAPGGEAAVLVQADYAQEAIVDHERVVLLRGRCRIEQGRTVLSARTMVVWHAVDGADDGRARRDTLVVYAEDEARLERVGSTRAETSLLVRFATSAGVRAAVRRSTRDASLAEDASFRRAVVRRTADDRGGLQPVRPVSRATPTRPEDARPGDVHAESPRAGAVRRASGTTAEDDVGDMPIFEAELPPLGTREVDDEVLAQGPAGPGLGSDPFAGPRAGPSAGPIALPAPGDPGPELRAVAVPTPGGALRRVRIFPRSAVPYNVLSFESNRTTPPEQIWVVTGGVNLIVDGLREFDTVDLAADRMVIWTQAARGGEFSAETVQPRDTPFQVYLEGNITIRQRNDQPGPVQSDLLRGEKLIRASRAFYDARDERALLHDAELKAHVPQLGGNIRVRAERLRQLSRNNFHAQQAWASTSEFGRPGYRLQATDIFLEDRPSDGWFGSRTGQVDPLTGLSVQEEVPWVTSLGNSFLVEDVPLLYAPYASFPAEDPGIPVRRATIGQDSIFGTRVNTVWNLFKILGIDEPRGVRWDLLADYLSDRGPGIGTSGEYRGSDLLGMPGTFGGEGLGYYVNDGGLDNLGEFRRALVPATDDRYRLQFRHRQDLPDGFSLFAEMGILSDRNFLEQYYEGEFDNGKDVETLLYGRKVFDNIGLTALGSVRPNEFEYSTEWLPRGDAYVLGEPLLGGWLNWSTHSSAGYGRLRTADPPTDPNDPFVPIPFYEETDGAVLTTRHRLAAPFNLGPVIVDPYVQGEAAYWSADYAGDSLDRLVGTAGVKASLMMWRPLPYVQSRVFNLNGLAHKMLFEVEYAFTESTRDLSEVPQYNSFDDDSQERFREHFPLTTFGGALPATFDPQAYAVRSGAGSDVSVPWHELVDDQQVVRFAWRHRWQTKVGPPGAQRIKDWMKLDLEASFFPDAARDNYGEDFGLLGARYRWNVGDRTSLLAGAQVDLFDPGQRLWNVGVLSQRGERGSLYLGLRQVEGGSLQSRIATGSFSYQMSPKWVSSLGTAYDLGEHRNLGQSLTVTRVGADFLFHLGANYNNNKDNVGIAFMIQPRFGPWSGNFANLGSLGAGFP